MASRSSRFCASVADSSRGTTRGRRSRSRRATSRFRPLHGARAHSSSRSPRSRRTRPDSSSLYARYRVTNSGRAAASTTLYLAVRPFQVNPSWQFLATQGGAAPIAHVAWEDSVLRVNDSLTVVPLTAPSCCRRIDVRRGRALSTRCRAGCAPRRARGPRRHRERIGRDRLRAHDSIAIVSRRLPVDPLPRPRRTLASLRQRCRRARLRRAPVGRGHAHVGGQPRPRHR